MECLIDDIHIFYEEFGNGKPILCLHGFPQDHRTMMGCIEPLPGDSTAYRRIYLDLPGMGRSNPKPWLKSANQDFIVDYQKNSYGFSFESSFDEINFKKTITLVTGKQDNCVVFEDSYHLLQHLTQLQYVCLENAGHNLQLEQENLFNKTFHKWIKSIN